MGLILIEMRLKKDSNWMVAGVLVGSISGGRLQREPAAAQQADGDVLVHGETFQLSSELQTTSVMKRERKMKGRRSTRVSRWKLHLLFSKCGPLSLH